ncbi:FAD-dependent oxidoreductase [Amycolatopsis sp. GM8]|uniref:NAD(P)/FAD-dependent oxidoreductase n=1 Tax=Amycolatopsis sp. GM8 TaxID=2896530 RepID=UPI001F1E3A22|nr:FAD-dependent oxidoreductase [Amycolatopsis sp. GM8]
MTTTGTLAPGASVVVVGTGQAGFQFAASLRDAGHTGPLTLVGDEPGLPYQRPPLSKAYLGATADGSAVLLRTEAFYTSRDIRVRPRTRVSALDTAARRLELSGGERLHYDHLVLATGTRARPLPVPGTDLAGVAVLRTLTDADSLRVALAEPRDVVIIGGGFIGMEVAAAAVVRGHRVTVVESLDRPMARAVAPAISGYLTELHRSHGVRLLLGRAVRELHGSSGAVRSVELDDGEKIDADLVLIGIGALPNTDLAAEAGLGVCPVTGGIEVDEHLRTSDPHISAIGDCASYPSVHAPGPTRLESVQNAVDHARHLAARLTTGVSAGYRSVPWFWTHQYDAKLQIAGLGTPGDDHVLLGDDTSGSFSVLRFSGDRLVAVESVNKPSDHMAARKILAPGGRRPEPTDARQDGFELRTFLRGR